MRILTPNAKYFLDVRDDIPDEKDRRDSQQVVKEAWVENVYQIHSGDFTNEKPIFVDLGANIGAVSLQVASFNDYRETPIKIYAIEPELRNLAVLKSNIELNGKTDDIVVIEKAVTGSKPMIPWYMTNQGGNSHLTSTDNGSNPVELVTLEELLDSEGIIECDVLKVDIEGGEYLVLAEASFDTLRRIKYLALEFTGSGDVNDDPLEREASAFERLVGRLAEVFNLHVIGRPSTGGYIYGRRY